MKELEPTEQLLDGLLSGSIRLHFYLHSNQFPVFGQKLQHKGTAFCRRGKDGALLGLTSLQVQGLSAHQHRNLCWAESFHFQHIIGHYELS